MVFIYFILFYSPHCTTTLSDPFSDSKLKCEEAQIGIQPAEPGKVSNLQIQVLTVGKEMCIESQLQLARNSLLVSYNLILIIVVVAFIT